MKYPSSKSASLISGRLPTVAKPDWKLVLRKKISILRKAELLPYRSHGTGHSLQIKGRLIESPGNKSKIFKHNKSMYNFFNTLRGLRSREIPGALMQASYRGVSQEFYTDSEGYFLLNLWFPNDPLEAGWHNVEVRLRNSIGGGDVSAVAPVFVPPADADFAVISDIDDTVINSSAFNKLTLFKLTLFKDAASRTVVDDVVPLYKRLVKGPTGDGNNPIFYLSRSGWNLNAFLQEFLDINELPAGPMFLRDLAWREPKSLALGSNNHKIDYIRTLLQTYQSLPFVLIGDSGQHDPETYWQIAIENPGRIKAMYFHDVERKSRRSAVAALTKDLERRGIPIMHSNRVEHYGNHMQGLGLI